MKYTEELFWILDSSDRRYKDDELYRRNIEFVHSLGLKCDCVGWCKLDLAHPRRHEIFSRIAEYCRTDGWKSRCLYTRRYQDTGSDWYQLKPANFRDSTLSDTCVEIPLDNGKIWDYRPIRAYQEPTAGLKTWWTEICVPERFRSTCLKHGLAEASDFFWLRDVGKYNAEQYFVFFPHQHLTRLADDGKISRNPKKYADEVGGSFPQVAQVFHTVQQFSLPHVYRPEDLAAGGIVGGYTSRNSRVILIHKDAAAILLEEKALTPASLEPALVLDEIPGGYREQKLTREPRPLAEYQEKYLREYEALKAKPRPQRTVTEKEALTQLRRAKRDRSEDFRKPLPKSQTPESSVWEPLLPYLRISNGGNLDAEGEYELLSLAEAMAENAAFQTTLAAEELLEEKPDGVVIAKCADGDAVLLCANGTVIRFSHEEPAAVSAWKSLAQFIFEALTE